MSRWTAVPLALVSALIALQAWGADLIQAPPDSTGKTVATFEKTEATQVVQVQKVLLAGRTPDDDALPTNAAPGASVYGLPVRKGDGHDVALGATTDADTALTVIGRLKKLLTLFPAAPVGGRLDVSIGASPATVPVSGTVTSNAGTGTRDVQGNLAHDVVESGNPVATGHLAVAHGASPTAVAAADRVRGIANRHGVPFVIGGHPNTVTFRANYTALQTNVAVVTASAGQKIVVTRCNVMADKANTVDVAARIGFGATTTPTGTGVVLAHPGIAAGSGVVEGSGAGILGIGADGEDLRITSEAPTGGSIDVVVSYHIVES